MTTFLFQYPIILSFLTVYGVLKAKILKWLAIPFSSGPHSVRPLPSPFPPAFILLLSIFPSFRVFSNELVLRIRRPKYWRFSFISPSNEFSGLISFGMDWLDLLAVQGTLKSLLQHHSSKASILQRSAFFSVNLFIRWYFTSSGTGKPKVLFTLHQ